MRKETWDSNEPLYRSYDDFILSKDELVAIIASIRILGFNHSTLIFGWTKTWVAYREGHFSYEVYYT
jgi:hypothetical protein